MPTRNLQVTRVMRSASFSRLPAAVYVLFIRVYLYVCGVYVRFLMCSASASILLSQTRRVFFVFVLVVLVARPFPPLTSPPVLTDSGQSHYLSDCRALNNAFKQTDDRFQVKTFHTEIPTGNRDFRQFYFSKHFIAHFEKQNPSHGSLDPTTKRRHFFFIVFSIALRKNRTNVIESHEILYVILGENQYTQLVHSRRIRY